MKIKFHRPEDYKPAFKVKTLPSEVSINSKTGRIAFSKELSKIMNLSEGDKVIFFEVEQEAKGFSKQTVDWFVAKDTNGFQIVSSGNMFGFNNRAFAVHLLNQLDKKGYSYRIPVSIGSTPFPGQPDKPSYALLTIGIKETSRKSSKTANARQREQV